MATVSTRYGRLYVQGWRVFSEDGSPLIGAKPESSLTFPLDLLFLLGSESNEDVERAINELETWYYAPGLLSPPQKGSEADPGYASRRRRNLRRRCLGWRRDGTVATFVRAAKRATEGRFTAEIGPHLERVHYRPAPEPDEVGDFLALAAWVLDQALRAGKYEIKNCRLCGQPFMASGRARYCQRLAPQAELTAAAAQRQDGRRLEARECQDFGKVKDYRERKRAGQRPSEAKTTRA